MRKPAPSPLRLTTYCVNEPVTPRPALFCADRCRASLVLHAASPGFLFRTFMLWHFFDGMSVLLDGYTSSSEMSWCSTTSLSKGTIHYVYFDSPALYFPAKYRCRQVYQVHHVARLDRTEGCLPAYRQLNSSPVAWPRRSPVALGRITQTKRDHANSAARRPS